MTDEDTTDQTQKQPSTTPDGLRPLSVGDRVRIVERPPYVKTADPMPMLRPPDVITLGEEGTILDRRSGNDWNVRLTKGVFLLESRYMERLDSLSQ